MGIISKKYVKLIELILASCCLAVKFGAVDYEVSRSSRRIIFALIISTTYCGYCYLIATLTASSFKGSDLQGALLTYYNVLGAVLYILCELILWTGNWEFVWVTSTLLAFILAIFLILEALGIL